MTAFKTPTRIFLTLTATLVAITAINGSALAAPKKAAAGEMPSLKPLGNPNAPQGGTFNYNLGAEPSTLNPITSSDAYSSIVHTLTMDTLMHRDSDTWKWVPALAEKMDVSADGKSYTFTLRKGVKWSDGEPLTADDVKFSFDCIFDDKYNAMPKRPYYDGIEKVEVVDPNTVRFTTKMKYFGNLDSINDLTIVPKHVYGDVEEGKKKNKTLVGSGPYKIEKYDQGQNIMLVRNHDWWGNSVEYYKGQYNFEHVRLRFIKDENISLETAKKGELDLDGLSPEQYVKKTDGPEWGKTVFKEKVEILAPKGTGFIGWNLLRPIFKDRDTRMALYMLMNREEMNQKFRYGMSLLATGPWYRQNEYADPNVKPVLYNPKKALELLKKAGWTDSDKDGILDKVIDGKKTNLSFTVQHSNKDSEKYLVLYQQDLKKVGVEMKIENIEWNAFVKNLDEFNFDAVFMAWTGGDNPDYDPKQIWHSSFAVKGGSNFISYKNPEVDKLIDEARQELDKKKRLPMMRKVYALIANDVPYAFLFNDRYTLYAHTDKVKMLKPAFKYEIGWHSWWSADPTK